MEVQYEYTVDDFIEAQISAVRIIPQLRRVQRLALLVGLAILVSLPVVLLTGARISYSDPRLWIFPAMGLYMVLTTTLLRPLLLRRQFRQNPHIAGRHSARFGEEGIQLAGPESRSEMAWAAIDRFTESKNLFVLVHFPKMIYLFPKRAFTPEQLAEFRELLLRKLPTK
ncbi:MAG: YcxB family protein [Acidobacteriota bacterium]|nr:YcxB family protein [Acidobacteriota bacterium]